MTTYDNPNRQKYSPGSHDFGAGGEVFAFQGPLGKKGRIIDYGIEMITETFNAVTTEGSVSVGTVADPDAYGEEIGLGTSAVDTGTVSLRRLYRPQSAEIGGGGPGTVLVDPSIEADAIVALHCVAPVGGTPAGIAVPFVIIDWAD